MRLLIMLAVMWAAGSWLFAAESSPPAREKPAAPAPAQAAAAPQAVAPAPAPGAEKTDKEVDGPAAQGEETVADDNASTEGDESKESKQNESKEAATAKTGSAADAGASPRRFVPSEQVRADFDVSFPIDI